MKKVNFTNRISEQGAIGGGRLSRQPVDRDILLGQGVSPRSLLERVRSRVSAGGSVAVSERDLNEVVARLDNLVRVCPDLEGVVGLSDELASRVGSPVERGLGSRRG